MASLRLDIGFQPGANASLAVIAGDRARLPGRKSAGALDLGDDAGYADKRREQQETVHWDAAARGGEQRTECAQRDAAEPELAIARRLFGEHRFQAARDRSVEIKIDIGLGNEKIDDVRARLQHRDKIVRDEIL